MTPVNSVQKIIREQRFDLPSSSYRVDRVGDILRELQGKKFTGKLTVNLSQGGVQSVTAEDWERVNLPPTEIGRKRIFRGEADITD